ncbi:MAG: hypothetical protein RJA98_1973 [Pseudomonadota bacterium]|jgi:L-ascorbate metabolism protein UlaG (beta-lactamase superfamily)
MKKPTQVILSGVAATGAALLLGAFAFLQQPQFGADPDGDRLQRIQRSQHHANGEFHNLIPTPVLAEGNNPLSIMVSDLLHPVGDLQPAQPIPTVKTDLRALDLTRDALIWLGHSSFFIQIAGQRVLVDPVLKPYAGPVSFAGRAFDGTNGYTVDDMPDIDLLLITHDHWDHLDHDTVTALQGRVKQVVVPLGVGAHVERWGYARDKVRDADWNETLALHNGLSVHVIPARHYSGRALTPNKTLWAGFVLESGQRRVLLSGDSGYGPHYKTLGQRFGTFDLVALDMGQYDPRWPDIHMTPQQAAQAAQDLNARALLPAHVSRFTLARHAWNDPFEQVSAESQGKPYQLLTPRIGEALYLGDPGQRFLPWWRAAKQIAATPTLQGMTRPSRRINP